MAPSSTADDLAVHRALASSTRRSLLDTLRQHDAPIDAGTLASDLDLHVTTVRGHLVLLEQAGLVSSTTVHDGQPGRPTTVYLATSRPATPERTAGYQLLAEILIDGLASAPPTTDPSQWAHQVGERWGPRLIDRLGFRGTGTPSQVMHTSFEAMGFAPETTPDQVRLHACPFADLAMGHEHVVCDLHLGMARGMLADLDADVTADELTPFVGPSLCVLALTEQ